MDEALAQAYKMPVPKRYKGTGWFRNGFTFKRIEPTADNNPRD